MNVTLHINGKPVTVEILERKAREIQFRLNGKTYRFLGQTRKDGGFLLDEEIAPGVWQRENGTIWNGGKNVRRVQLGALDGKVSEAQQDAVSSGAADALSPLAPMPGLIRKILVKKGDTVEEGQPLVVMEAMKLQLTLSAGGSAIVAGIRVKEGEMVAEGAELVQLTATAGKKARSG